MAATAAASVPESQSLISTNRIQTMSTKSKSSVQSKLSSLSTLLQPKKKLKGVASKTLKKLNVFKRYVKEIENRHADDTNESISLSQNLSTKTRISVTDESFKSKVSKQSKFKNIFSYLCRLQSDSPEVEEEPSNTNTTISIHHNIITSKQLNKQVLKSFISGLIPYDLGGRKPGLSSKTKILQNFWN